MIAYSYDKNTKEFNGTVTCQLDPLQTKIAGKDVWMKPANSTFVRPSQIATGKTNIYDNGAWIVMNDYRGKKAYNSAGIFVVDYIGDMKEGDRLLSAKQIEGLDNGTLIWKDGEIIEKPAPTIEEQVVELEQRYGMVRWQREGILAEGSLYSDYVKAKAREIEDLAGQLRV